MEAVEYFYLDEWKEIVNARANMAASSTFAINIYEGIESVIYRVAHNSDLRFLEKIEDLVREDNCLNLQDILRVIDGFRRFVKCTQCQKEKFKESKGYFLLNRKNWKNEAEKMLSVSQRYYGVDDSMGMRRRNMKWADRFVELVKEGKRLTTFVGVAHLVGDGSFVEELEKKGFTVTEIPWTDQDE